jgi:hypothetical protein
MLQSHNRSGILGGDPSRFRRGGLLQLLSGSVRSMYRRFGKIGVRIIARGCVDVPMDDSLFT